MSIEQCPKCNAFFESLVTHGKQKKKFKKTFCSRKCANSRSWDAEHKQKISEINKNLYLQGILLLPSNKHKGKEKDKWETKICLECNAQYEDYKKTLSKYCSKKCALKNSGGYREGSGRSKNGYYKQIYCGSTYELAWVIYRLDHGLSAVRFPGCLICPDTNKKYYPDFFDKDINTIYEIKGYEKQDSVDIKTQIAKKHGFLVEVLRKDDLKIQFEWVKGKYNTNKFEILYDNLGPIV